MTLLRHKSQTVAPHRSELHSNINETTEVYNLRPIVGQSRTEILRRHQGVTCRDMPPERHCPRELAVLPGRFASVPEDFT
jgi:hypothetical protein